MKSQEASEDSLFSMHSVAKSGVALHLFTITTWICDGNVHSQVISCEEGLAK